MHGARDFQSCCIAADIRSVCQIFNGKLIVMNVMHRMFRRGIGNGEGSVGAVGRVRRGLAAVGVAAAAAGLLLTAAPRHG